MYCILSYVDFASLIYFNYRNKILTKLKITYFSHILQRLNNEFKFNYVLRCMWWYEWFGISSAAPSDDNWEALSATCKWYWRQA